MEACGVLRSSPRLAPNGERGATFHHQAFELPPDARGKPLFPAITIKGGAAQLNLGQTPLLFPPPPGVRSFAEAGVVAALPEGADALAKGQIIGRTWATAASVLPTYTLGAGSSAGLALENDVVLQAKHPGMPAVR